MSEMYNRKVETLRNLALKCSLYTLKSTIRRLPENLSMSYDDPRSVVEKKYESFMNNNWKKVNEMVEYHRPHREFLSAAQIYEDCFKLLDQHMDLYRRPFYFLIFWLCYENKETIKLGERGAGGYCQHKIKILYASMKKFQIELRKCKEASIGPIFMIFTDDEVKNLEMAKDLFHRMPNLEKLQTNIHTSEKSYHLQERFWAEEISGFNHLTTLSTSLDEREISYFSLFVKNSRKTLKKLEICYFYANCNELLSMFLQSLDQLLDLTTLNIGIVDLQEVIEKCEYSFTITSVRKMRVRIESFMSLSFVDKFFDGVEDLEIMYSNGDEWTVNRMTHDEKTMIVNVLCGMSKLQKINSLTLLYDEVIPIPLTALWKIFPNITEFVTFGINAKDADLDFVEVRSIQRLVILGQGSWGGIHPPHILSKMHNLKELIFNEWYCDDDFEENRRCCEQHLPKNCQLSVKNFPCHSRVCLNNPFICLELDCP